jgi:hypothetical protein
VGKRELDVIAELAAGVVHYVQLGTDWRIIDEADAFFSKGTHRTFDIVNGKSNVMETFTACRDELGDYAVVCGCFHEFEVDLTYTAHTKTHVVTFNLDDLSGFSVKQVNKQPRCLFQVSNCNPYFRDPLDIHKPSPLLLQSYLTVTPCPWRVTDKIGYFPPDAFYGS